MAILLKPEYEHVLQDLAKESSETVDELLSRLIQKEHFERHYTYDGLSGKLTPKQCMCRECFMKKRVSS
jgi:hypothetical protein